MSTDSWQVEIIRWAININTQHASEVHNWSKTRRILRARLSQSQRLQYDRIGWTLLRCNYGQNRWFLFIAAPYIWYHISYIPICPRRIYHQQYKRGGYSLTSPIKQHCYSCGLHVAVYKSSTNLFFQHSYFCRTAGSTVYAQLVRKNSSTQSLIAYDAHILHNQLTKYFFIIIQYEWIGMTWVGIQYTPALPELLFFKESAK